MRHQYVSSPSGSISSGRIYPPVNMLLYSFPKTNSVGNLIPRRINLDYLIQPSTLFQGSFFDLLGMGWVALEPGI